MDDKKSELMTVKEFAAGLSFDEGTVRRWILLRRIEYVKIMGGGVRIKRSVYDAMIAAGTIAAR